MNILLTGASGLLGKHLRIEADRPSHEEMDITKPIDLWEDVVDFPARFKRQYNLIVHCAAYTKVEQAEIEREECFKVNVWGTMNLVNTFPDTPIVYISSEYAYRPVNYYSLTKYLAEKIINTCPNSLIIRTLFKPRPWKYPKAFVDQYTMGDYVDVIAPLIDKEILNWRREGRSIIYIGTGRKTIYDLAKQTRDVEPISVKDIKGVKLPIDYE